MSVLLLVVLLRLVCHLWFTNCVLLSMADIVANCGLLDRVANAVVLIVFRIVLFLRLLLFASPLTSAGQLHCHLSQHVLRISFC